MTNIYIWIAVALLLFYGSRIIGFISLLRVKVLLDFPIDFITRKDVDSKILKSITPYENYLFEQGFRLDYIVTYSNLVVGQDLLFHSFIYYNPQNGVIATLNTQPHKNALEPVAINFYTFYDDGTLCWSMNGHKFYYPAFSENFYVYDDYLANWKDVYSKHLEHMQKDGKVIINQPFTKKDVIDFIDYFHKSNIDEQAKRGYLKLTDKYYSYKPSIKLWKFLKNLQGGYKRYRKILNSVKVDKLNGGEIGCKNALLNQLENFDKSKIKNSNSWVAFFISGVIFISLFMLMGSTFSYIVNLIIVLLVHELGHFLAMRFFGYSDTSIFFLPFGAATTGQKREKKAYEEFIVLLAGPLPGIIIGIALWLTAGHFGKYEHFAMEYAFVSIVVNYLNLLPIYPLDGGKIVETLLLLRYPKVQFYFYVVGLLVLIVAMIAFRDALLFIFVVLLALGLGQSYKVSKLLSKLKKVNMLSQDGVASVLCEDSDFKANDLNTKVTVAQRALSILNTSKPGKIFTILAFAFYLILLTPIIFISTNYLATISTPYSKLNKAQRKEISDFYAKLFEYDKISVPPKKSFDIDSSMKSLESYFKENNITQKPPLKGELKVSAYPCKIPDSLQKVLKWHNGVDYVGDVNLYSAKEIKKYFQVSQKSRDFDKKYLPIGLLDDEDELYINCDDGAIYEYYDKPTKLYYSLEHLLAIWAKAYDNKVATIDSKRYKINYNKLAKIENEFLSKEDKAIREKKIAYINKKALEYLKGDVDYFKLMVLRAMDKDLSSKYIGTLKLYSKDKSKKVSTLAKNILKDALAN